MSTFLAEAGLLDNVPTTARSIVSYVKKTVIRLYNWFSICSLYSHNRARCSLSKFSAIGIHSFTKNLLSLLYEKRTAQWKTDTSPYLLADILENTSGGRAKRGESQFSCFCLPFPIL